MPKIEKPEFSQQQVVRLWLARQGLLDLEKKPKLNKTRFVELLENTGGLQVDSVNVLDRAHYLTLWSRFGNYRRSQVDKWLYQDRLAYEYWGHEACILPISHLPIGKRRMKEFPPEAWANSSYWKHYDTNEDSKKRVLRVIRKNGPLESADFEKTRLDQEQARILGWGSLIPKEDKRSLQLLWHAGKLAVHGRKHFRKIYDQAKNIYPACRTASTTQFHDSWLLIGLSGCGIASEKHLVNYITGPNLKAPERREVLARNLRKKTIVEVKVGGFDGRWFALPELLEGIDELPEPSGTTLLCPFDSLLWQRKRAEELMEFRYRVEIYVPESKREFGYYVLPILHNGRMIGRLDPKLHRSEDRLEIRAFYLEPGIKLSKHLRNRIVEAIESLALFVDARAIDLPKSLG